MTSTVHGARSAIGLAGLRAAAGRRAGFSLLEVLLVSSLVAVVLFLVTGLVVRVRETSEECDRRVNRTRAARAAMERLSADIRSCVYCGPLSRYAVGLDGRAADHGDAAGAGDVLTLVVAGVPKGLKVAQQTADDQTQNGRGDLRIVRWQVQTDQEGRRRLVRMEQALLEAVERGELTVEVLCDDVEEFHLQYFGKTPPVVEDPSDTAAVAEAWALQEPAWSHDWKTGFAQDGGNGAALQNAGNALGGVAGAAGTGTGTGTAGGATGTDPAALAGAAAALAGAAGGAGGTDLKTLLAQMPPEQPLPSAVMVVLVLQPLPRADGSQPEPGAESEGARNERTFETIVRPMVSPEPTAPLTALQGMLPAGVTDALKAFQGTDPAAINSALQGATTGGTMP